MGQRLQEFVADDLWLLIGVVTFALSGLVGVAGFGGLMTVIAIIGWFLLAPIFLFWGEDIAAWAFDERKTAAGTERETEDDPVAELKRRYAAGEIDDEEFERRLDRLLAVDDALEGVFDASEQRHDRPETTDHTARRETADPSRSEPFEYERETDR